MPYVLVETTDAVGNKELIAAPDGWIQRQSDGKQFLCWPNVRNINSLNALLQDECSVPSLMWEKHECVIKRQNLLSLALATKAMDGFQKQSEKAANANTVPSSSTSNFCHKAQQTWEKPVEGDTVSRIIDDALVANGPPEAPSYVPESFATLKRLLDKNQEEMLKKMDEGFYRMQETLVSLMQNSGSMKNSTEPSVKSPSSLMHKRESSKDSTAPSINLPSSGELLIADASKNCSDFNMKPLKTVEEMDKFEARLNYEDYRRQVLSWIDSSVAHRNNPEGRLMDLLDLMFDRFLLPEFTWTERGAKRSYKRNFSNYDNIVALFTYAGTTLTHRADWTFVSQFFKKKLSHASTRAATLKGLRRCVPHTLGTRKKRQQLEKSPAKRVAVAGESSTHVKTGRFEFKITPKCEPEDFDEEEEYSSQDNEYKLDSADRQDVIVEDDQYVEYGNIELKPMDMEQLTLFMSAEHEQESD